MEDKEDGNHSLQTFTKSSSQLCKEKGAEKEKEEEDKMEDKEETKEEVRAIELGQIDVRKLLYNILESSFCMNQFVYDATCTPL